MFNSDSKEKTIICSILIIALILLIISYSLNIKNNYNEYFKILLIIIIIICLIVYIVKIKGTSSVFEKYSFKNKDIDNKYKKLINYIGLPTYIEKNKNSEINSVTWMSPLDNYHKNKFAGKTCSNRDGLDFIKILGFKGRKHHPIPADMYIIAGKYMNVPPELIGLLKNASETINIEQLQVPHKLNNYFGKDFKHDKKGQSLVTGSCASVTISAITIKFVEDFINSYDKDNKQHNDVELVKRTYDKYLIEYLCEEKEPNIPWFNPSDFGEPITMPKIEKCSKIDMKSYKNILKVSNIKDTSKDTFLNSHKKAN